MSTSILVADDSLTIQKVVELTFLEDDYEVTSVSSGEEAMSHIDGDAPDVVIADIHMPAPSGYQVCRRVKEARPGTPVLLLVGTFEELDEAEVAACGADGTLKKPFDSQELLQRVESFLGRGGGGKAGTYEDTDSGLGGLLNEPAIGPAGDLSEAHLTGQIDDATASLPEFELADLDAPEIESVSDHSMSAGFSLESEEEEETDMESVPPVSDAELSDRDVDRIARRVVELLGDDLVRELAWEVVPDLAEVAIKDRIREIENQVE